MADRSPLSKDDRAKLAAAVEAGRAARAEMGSGKISAVPRKRELRRVIREGDEAAGALANAGDDDGLAQ